MAGDIKEKKKKKPLVIIRLPYTCTTPCGRDHDRHSKEMVEGQFWPLGDVERVS